MNNEYSQHREECIQLVLSEIGTDPSHSFESPKAQHDRIGQELDALINDFTRRIEQGKAILRQYGGIFSKEDPKTFSLPLLEELNKIQESSIDLEAYEEEETPSKQLQYGISDEAMSCFFGIAQKLMLNHQFQEAAEAFFLIVDLNPYEPQFLLGLGSAQYYNQDYEKALSTFGFSQICIPDDPRPFLYGAHCCEALSDYEHAIELTLLALEKVEEHPEFHDFESDTKKYLKKLQEHKIGGHS